MANDNLKGIVETAGRVVGTAVGTAAGMAAGAVSALVGTVPAQVDPANEELYWREHFASEPYYDANFSFEDYLPAWRVGWEGRGRHAGRKFDDIEQDLKAEFHWNRGESRLLWDQARAAARAAFERK
jgi:hypothetical protein